MRIHGTAVIPEACIDDGEIEVYDEILVVVRCWVLANIEVTIQPFELVGVIDVIIMVQHRQGEALAKAARADEEEELVGFLHFLYKPCLVHIVAVVFAYCHEVHHAIRYAFGCSFHCLFFHNRYFWQS